MLFGPVRTYPCRVEAGLSRRYHWLSLMNTDHSLALMKDLGSQSQRSHRVTKYTAEYSIEYSIEYVAVTLCEVRST
jgi:hypothetical protein